MNNNDTRFIAQKIRTQYMEDNVSELDALRALDKKVKRPANVFSYIFGSVSAIIMGTGMSLVMTDIGESIGISNAMVPGIIIGVLGMALAIANYPIHRRVMASRREKYKGEIIKLSEKILEK